MESEDTTTRTYQIVRTLSNMFAKRGYHLIEETGWPDLVEKNAPEAARKTVSGEQILQALQFKEDGSFLRICVFFHSDALAVKDIQRYCVKMKELGAYRGVVIVEKPLRKVTANALAEVGPLFFIETFEGWELLVDITKHYLVPCHSILSEAEKNQMLKRHRLTIQQLPRIKRDDPMARYLGMHVGQVVKIVRKSKISGRYVTYRVCM